MRGKKKKLFIALAMAVMLSSSICLTACGGSTSDNSSSQDAPITEKATTVWSTYSTAKVIRDVVMNDEYTQKAAKIDVSLMKNEVEGAQLIITAGEDIASYAFNTTDLKDGKGNTIPKANIAVYHQKYHELTSKRTSADTGFAVGDYIPDMLLPLDIATEYGENKIAANQNQGITVEIETTRNTVPGIYTGTFELVLDGEKQEIPVRVEVWDIEFTGRREQQSSFLIYQNQILSGEYDNSEEVISNYSDFMLKYKANAMIWKGDADRYYDADAWMEEQRRLFQNENYTSIYIPYYFNNVTYNAFEADGTTLTNNAKNCFKYLTKIVEASCEDNINYIEYAYNYVIHLDEADWVGADPQGDRAKNAERLLGDNGEIRKTYNAFIDQLDTNETYAAMKESNPEYAASIRKALSEITTLFVNVNYMEDWVGELDTTFCTYLHTYADGAVVDKYAEAAASKSNGDLWTYIANSSMSPTPSFHTDELTLGMRVAGWMQKAYNINGFLYWNTSYYRVNGNAENFVDVYEDLDRAGYVTGDGFLLYPGRKYGSDSPFASMRLVSYRDSMDDYDMLSVYERLLNEHAAEYGLGEVDLNDYVQDLYDSLFKGATYNTEDELIFAAREELANRILALQNDDKVLFTTQKSGAGTQVTVYAKENTLTVDGESKTGEVAGNGYVYTLSYDDTARDITVKTASNTYTYRVAATSGVGISTANVSCSEGSTAEVNGDKVVVNAKSAFRGEANKFEGETLYFRPFVKIACDGLADIDSLYFTIKNVDAANSFDARVEVLVGDAERVVVLGTVYCAAGEETKVALRVFDSLKIDSSEIKAIRISFDNVHNRSVYDASLNEWVVRQELYQDKTFEVSNVYYDKK